MSTPSTDEALARRRRRLRRVYSGRGRQLKAARYQPGPAWAEAEQKYHRIRDKWREFHRVHTWGGRK